ncbi:hypothetical protein F5Y12DRAFT_799495 [Xylaria sp. FL1777]|nr:hypothetical protein F5Y12DRAFT_799495 [Xylaria sp. FL1777]
MLLPEPPPGLDMKASQVGSIYAGLLIPWIFAILNVVLRFTARRLIRNGIIRAEDWLALFALTAATAQVFSTLFFSIPHGLGRHIWVGPPDAMRAASLALFIAEITYTVTMTVIKYSTLVFYWHVFSMKKSIRVPIMILSGLISLWGIAIILVTSLQCIPTRATWERFDPVNPLLPSEYKCGVDVGAFVIANAVPNIITDALIVLLPIPYVLSLHLRRSQKIALGGTFLLGLLVTLTSVLRLAFFQKVAYTDPDVTWTFTVPVIWSNVECNLAIAVSSLPFLKPILNLILHRRVSDPSTTNKSGRAGGTTASASVLGHRGSNMPGLASNIQTSVTTRRGEDTRPFARLSDTESSGSVGEDAMELNNFDNGGILITKEFRILNKDQE